MKPIALTPRITRKYIRDLIVSEREKQELGPGALEKKAQVPRDAVRDFEHGKAHIMRAEKLQKVLNALGYDLVITRLALVFIIVVLCLGASPAQATFWNKNKTDLGHATIEVAFSPHMGATELVVKAISEAKKSIRVAAYSFTSKPIAQALLDAHKRGIDVKAVVDRSQARAKYTSANFLANVGIPTRIDYEYAIMHNKFMVIDDINIELGSFNYTTAAEHKNAENVMVIRNDPAVANQYNGEWEKLWNESEELPPKY